MWRLFKTTKTPNYDHLRRSIKHEMLHWADKKQFWIEVEVGVAMIKKSKKWPKLKFEVGNL